MMGYWKEVLVVCAISVAFANAAIHVDKIGDVPLCNAAQEENGRATIEACIKKYESNFMAKMFTHCNKSGTQLREFLRHSCSSADNYNKLAECFEAYFRDLIQHTSLNNIANQKLEADLFEICLLKSVQNVMESKY